LNSINQETTEPAVSGATISKERRLNNLLGDIHRSSHHDNEPHRHIDRLFLQCKEAIEIFESLDSETQKKYIGGSGTSYIIGPAKDLYNTLGRLSVKVKNAMTNSSDFQMVTSVFNSFDESVLLKLIEMNRVESEQNQEKYKKFIDKVLWEMPVVGSVEEAVEMAKDILVVGSSRLEVFRKAVSQNGVSREQYIYDAVMMRLKSEGYLEPK
jgi:hypothetical protein